MQGSDKFQSSKDGMTRGKPQISVSRVASAISQLADRKGSKLTDIRNAINSQIGVQPTFLQLKTIVRRGIREGALSKATQNRFMVNSNTRETIIKRRRKRSQSIDSGRGRRRRPHRSRARRRKRRRSRRRRRRGRKRRRGRGRGRRRRRRGRGRRRRRRGRGRRR